MITTIDDSIEFSIGFEEHGKWSGHRIPMCARTPLHGRTPGTLKV
jgi:hypothetical protein